MLTAPVPPASMVNDAVKYRVTAVRSFFCCQSAAPMTLMGMRKNPYPSRSVNGLSDSMKGLDVQCVQLYIFFIHPLYPNIAITAPQKTNIIGTVKSIRISGGTILRTDNPFRYAVQKTAPNRYAAMGDVDPVSMENPIIATPPIPAPRSQTTPNPPENPRAVSMNPPNVSLAVPPGVIPMGDSIGIAPMSNHNQLMKLRHRENMTMTMQKYRHCWNNVLRFKC
jgi:hypothetical protein